MVTWFAVPPKTNSFVLFVATSILFGFAGFLVHYSKVENLEFLFADYEDLLSISGMSDSGYYLLGGNALSKGEILGENRWIFNLWPPGMAHVYALIIAAGLPIGLTMLVVSSAVYGLVLTQMWALLEKHSQPRTATLGLIIGLANPFAIASLGPSSLLYSDGLGSSLLALTFLSWIVWVPTLAADTLTYVSGVSGLLFGVSSVLTVSLRWSLVPVVGILWIWAAIFAIRKVFGSGGNRGTSPVIAGFGLLKAALVAAFTAFPWTIFVATILHPPNPLWSIGTEYTWAHRWLLDDDLPGFLVSGNANWACDLDPGKCDALRPLALGGGSDYSLFQNEALKTAISHPFGFFSTGVSDFMSGFFSAPFSGVGLYSGWYFSAISAFLILGALTVSVARRNWLGLSVTTIIVISTLLTLALFHVESRYLLPVHFFAFTVGVYLIFARRPSVFVARAVADNRKRA